MKETTSRILLYGSAALAIGGLAVAWANTSTDADVVTLLSSANAQLQMAYVIPANDLNGNPLDKRLDMILAATEHLEKVEAIEPGMACTAEFRGFAHMLVGEYAEAAGCYRAARNCDDCAGDMADVLTFNQARMLAKAGHGERALAVFAANKTALDARYGAQRRLEESKILRDLGRVSEAKQRLDSVSQEDVKSPMSWVQAGREYTALGCYEAAEKVLMSVREDVVIADYYLADLKLRQGEADTSIELLERVSKALPTEVRLMLRQEAKTWAAVAENARFQELSKLLPAAPGR